MQEYFLDSNAHTKLNLSLKQLSSINFNPGIDGNPMSPNKIGREASLLIETSREKIANSLKTNPQNIFFCHSCTEANYWASIIISNNYCKRQYEKDIPNETCLISPFEHTSIVSCLPIIPFMINYAEVRNNKLEIKPTDNSIFIGVQNEIGIIADFNKIRRNTKNLFFSDMAQAPGKISINLKELDADIATFGAHKFGGGHIGILYLKNPDLICKIYDGAQYMQDMLGTPDVYGIAISAVALENAINNMDDNNKKAESFQQELETGLENLGFEIIGKEFPRIKTTTLTKVPGNGLELLLKLSNKNIYVGLGSACGSFVEQPAKNIKALGYDCLNTELIRFSQDGRYNAYDAKYIVSTIKEML